MNNAKSKPSLCKSYPWMGQDSPNGSKKCSEMVAENSWMNTVHMSSIASVERGVFLELI